MKDSLRVKDDFAYLITFLPEGWQEKAKELGALRRCRNIPDAETLLHVLLVHLAEGCSLRETAVRVTRAGIATVSDVAIMDRLRLSGDWLRWMCQGMTQRWVGTPPSFATCPGRRVRLVDGTRVKEPGPTGSSWCIHYSVTLPTLQCCELTVQDSKGNGETFKKFTIEPGDLMIGDRVYGSPPGIAHVMEAGGDVLVRFAWNLLPLWEDAQTPFDLLAHLRSLSGTRAGDWDASVKVGDRLYQGRVCAVRKSRQATAAAVKQVKRAAQKHDSETQPETLETAGYMMVFTTLDRQQASPSAVLGTYRGRWQIELVFKRLKSLLGFGHLRKTDPDSARAWLHGKLLVALLVEALLRYGEAFSPSGYEIPETPAAKS